MSRGGCNEFRPPVLDQTILRMWRAGADTSSIAREFQVREYEIANRLPDILRRGDEIMKFNSEAARRIKIMRANKATLEHMIAFFNGKYDAEGLDWLVNEAVRRRKARYQETCAKTNKSLQIARADEAKPPADVVERREERRMLWPKTVTALLQGDPLPGESALDRRAKELA